MILLVEDDPDQRLALGLALKAAGYALREASSGSEALALQREHASPIVITDIFMPDADGFELIQALREQHPETKIVVISGGGKRTTRDYLGATALMGVEATLQKPVEIDTLLSTLERLRPGGRR
jgi:DNA-binding NtrC family response regulator